MTETPLTRDRNNSRFVSSSKQREEENVADALADLHWREVEELLDQFGSEEHLARRVKRWREAQGWTLEELGKKLNMNRSTVYKIENPSPGSPRRIQVEEVLRFARVFDKSFAEVLLPDMTIADLEGWKILRRAADTLNEIRSLSRQYYEDIEAVRHMITANPSLGERVAAYLASAELRQRDAYAEVWINDARDAKETKQRESLVEQSGDQLPRAAKEEYSTNTPAVQAASDALTDVPLTRRLWTKTLEPFQPTHPEILFRKK